MSFMAGFGPAFAEAFNSGMAQNRKNDADSFNKAWELFLKKDEERTRAEAANRKDWEWAEETAKLNRLPPEAAYKLYQYKQNGNFSESQLNAIAADTQGWKVGRNGEDVEVEYTDPRDEFGINEEQSQEEPQEDAQESPTANKRNTDFRGNIEERFKNVREPQQPQAPQAPQSPAIQGGPFARTGPRGDEAARADQLTRRVAQQAGVPVEQVQRTMSGSSAWQPPALPDGITVSYAKSVDPGEYYGLGEAIFRKGEAERAGNMKEASRLDRVIKSRMLEADLNAAAEKGTNLFYVKLPDGSIGHKNGMRTGDGKVISLDQQTYEWFGNVSEEEKRIWFELAKQTEDSNKLDQKHANMASAYQMVNQLKALGEISPGSLTTVAGGAAAIWQRVGLEATELAKLGADALGSEETLLRIDNLQKDIEEKIRSGGIKTTADYRTAMSSLETALIFKIAALEGFESRDVTNSKIEHVKSIIGNTPDVRRKVEVLANYLSNLEDNLDLQAKGMGQYNRNIDTLKTITDYSPVEKVSTSFSDYVSNTPMAGDYESIRKSRRAPGESGGAQPPAPAQTPQPRQSKIQEGMIIEFQDGSQQIRRNGKWEPYNG